MKTMNEPNKPLHGTGPFKIEKGVPLPLAIRRTGLAPALRRLSPGDSIFVPGKRPAEISSTYTRLQRELGWKFTTRTVDGGCRVWRVE